MGQAITEERKMAPQQCLCRRLTWCVRPTKPSSQQLLNVVRDRGASQQNVSLQARAGRRCTACDPGPTEYSACRLRLCGRRH